MQVGWATNRGHPERPDHVNEDFVGAVTDAVVLLDGAGLPGTEHLCVHGVEWYTRRLGGALLARLPDHGRPLPDLLADAIDEVADRHRDTCTIEDPSSPQAAVAVVRLAGERIDVLVLGDCSVVLARAEGDPVVITDGREAAVREECLAALSGMPRGSAEHARALGEAKVAFRARRNAPGGFWVAKDQPAAAHQAVLSSGSLEGVTGVGLLSNGVARLVEPYRVAQWPDLVMMLAGAGPGALVRWVRETESAHRGASWDPPDDATVAWLRPARTNGVSRGSTGGGAGTMPAGPGAPTASN